MVDWRAANLGDPQEPWFQYHILVVPYMPHTTPTFAFLHFREGPGR